MLVADPPNAVEIAPSIVPTDVIEVVARRADSTIKIDRRSYQVIDNAHSSQKDAIQLLRGLPAVTVTPDDRILVLGGRVTRIYIDGRPYIGDAIQYLGTIHGSDIERIEVITNPSAQFSSEGDGGTINLVLRKTKAEGVSGNASLQESSYGHALGDTTLNYKRGDLAYEIKAGGNVGITARRDYEMQRSVQTQASVVPTVNRENGHYTYAGTVGRLSGKATYRLNSKTTLSAKLGGGGGHDIVTEQVKYIAVTPDFFPFSERRRLNSVGGYVSGEMNLDITGKEEGETLNVGTQFFTNPDLHDVTTADFNDSRYYRVDLHRPSTSIDAQVDWKHPMADGQLLSIGSSWHLDQASQHYRFTSNDPGTLGADTSDAFDASSSTLAAYASLQQRIGALTVAAGFRGEANNRLISSFGTKAVHINRMDLFPSFHAGYNVSKALKIGASYSKRIERVPLEYLRPYGSVEDAYTIFQGNPNLQDQDTDGYELSFQFRGGNFEAGATAYLRNTHKLWSASYWVNATGASVYSYVNAGNSWKGGVQFDLSFPILARLKLRASANLFDDRTPIDASEGIITYHTFRYSTNGTLEWTGEERGNIPGDIAQMQWSYNSASRKYQIRESSWFDISLSYTHNLARKLSLSGTFRYASSTRQRLIAPMVEEFTARQRTPEFQLKLQKKL